MELKDRLESELRKPVQSTQDAQRVARIAEALAELLRASENATRVLGDSGEVPPSNTREDPGLASFTLHDAAERVLERAGIPLHVKELGRRIKGGGWRHPRGEPSRPDQLLYQLAARLPRHADKFRRVAPNTFALVKWGEKGTAKSLSRPRVGLFASESAITGRQAGQQQDEVAQGDEWRSS
jgi:hypothetical protein